jgi:enoyl-CoA hydratase/carnithine racemase
MDRPELTQSKLSLVGGTAVLALASDKVNALDLQLLTEITTVVEYCEQDPDVTALVLTGEGSLFSAGLNVNEILANDAHHTGLVLDALNTALRALFTCPLPTVVAVNGSAIAGGCLLACVFDTRLIADDARIGVTELKVGVAFPVLTVELLKHVSGPNAEWLMFDAGLLDADAACARGLVHRSLPSSELAEAALAEAARLASLDPRAYALAKAGARRSVLAAVDDEGGRHLDRQVLEHWQDDRTRAGLEKLLKPKR